MFGFLSLIGGFLDPISKITQAIEQERIAAVNAQTDQARINSQERIAVLQAQRDVLINQPAQSKIIDSFVRLSIVFPFIVYNCWLVLHDKLWMHGESSTDPLSSQLINVEMIAIGFYFVHSTAGLFRK